MYVAKHWYAPDGKLVTHAPRASGGLRPITVRDARAMGLLPSVTTILGALSKPALQEWYARRLVSAAMQNRPQDGEDEETYFDRIRKAATEVSRDAADLGTSCHSALENWLVHKTSPPVHLQPFLNSALDWLQENLEQVLSSETTLVSARLGYAGTIDLIAKVRPWGLAVIDFKTQACRNGKPVFWPEWPLQLAAYRWLWIDVHGLPAPEAMLSVVVNTAAAGPHHVKAWEPPRQYWKAFRAALRLFCYVNGLNAKGEE